MRFTNGRKRLSLFDLYLVDFRIAKTNLLGAPTTNSDIPKYGPTISVFPCLAGKPRRVAPQRRLVIKPPQTSSGRLNLDTNYHRSILGLQSGKLVKRGAALWYHSFS